VLWDAFLLFVFQNCTERKNFLNYEYNLHWQLSYGMSSFFLWKLIKKIEKRQFRLETLVFVSMFVAKFNHIYRFEPNTISNGSLVMGRPLSGHVPAPSFCCGS
jgi:hypothetical protein